jgi:hypothetical protein
MRLKIGYLPAFWAVVLICCVAANRAYSRASQDCFISKPEAALGYLKQDRAAIDPECARKAIEVIRTNSYRPAIDVLFRYLDFRPTPEGVPAMRDASDPTGREYPAADALFDFGKSILPRVKRVIRDGEQTPTSRLNAARIYFGLEPGPDAIRFIVGAAHDAGDADASTKLAQFAVDAVRYCAEEQRGSCELALGQ